MHWLVPRQGRDGPRFRMLASLRHFAAEQLDDATRKRAWAAHQAAWLPRARRAAQSFRQTGDPEASALLAEELEDLLAIAERTDEAATATSPMHAEVMGPSPPCMRGT